MKNNQAITCEVCHRGGAQNREGAETRSLVVSIITLITMGAEISFGLLSGSMALLADGIHMGTHAVALFITVLAYFLARRNRANPSFSFGPGKIGVLGGYTNALLLGGTAIFMVYEAVRRLLHPETIHFDSAIVVAIIGLAVNLICAFILKGSGGHQHAQHHGHDDSNLKAAFLHVVADALTSVLAIGALLVGKYFGWSFLDAAVGILGAILILRWAFGLIRESGAVLLDFGDYGAETDKIRERLGAEGMSLCDIHIWRYAENSRSLILTARDPRGRGSDEIRQALGDIGDFDHVTIEVCR
jgi:cation diffusion facilitator family transporter